MIKKRGYADTSWSYYHNAMQHIPVDCNINTQIWSTQTVNMQQQTAKLLTSLNVNTRGSNTMHQTIQKHIPSEHKNLLGWCTPKCIAQDPQWPQEPSVMMRTKMYSITSPVTRTFWYDAHQNVRHRSPVTTRTLWDDAHQNVSHNIPSDHKSLQTWCTQHYMTSHS